VWIDKNAPEAIIKSAGRTELQNSHWGTAYLADAQLQCTDLRGADLSHATLTGADLRGANLVGALLPKTLKAA
jgi:uncharacterized protein YjbI with pentapeptide repeats